MPEPRPDLTSIHILVVEDNEDTRRILGAYLEHLGATVTLARSGGEALSILTELRPHVILSDISMPGIDGFEFLRRARELIDQDGRTTPAIAFTAFADRHYERQAREAGFALFLTKPADPLDIAQRIHELVHGARERKIDSQQ
jgi:CheY-like chemotaxis protein